MPPITNKQILADLKKVGAVSFREYESLNRISPWTVIKRFGTWNNALAAAGAQRAAPEIGPVERKEKETKDSRLRREHARLVEELQEYKARELFTGKLTAGHAPPRILRSEKKSGLREATAVVVGSDWHVEEEVTLESSGGRNEWNLTIADESIRRFFRGAIDLVKHHRASKKIVIRDMVLALIGDLITGHIHDDLVEVAALAPMETCLWLQPRIRDGIRTVLDELDLRSLTIPWCYGNHGRSTKKPRIATGAFHSFEWTLGKQLQREFADEKRIQWDINPTPHQWAQVYDFSLRFHHGDSLSYQGGSGGLSIPLNKAVAAWNTERRADWAFVGHFHQFLDLNRALVNGSMIGYGPYSRWIRGTFEEPAQIFCLIDSTRGRAHTTPIWTRASKRSEST